MRLGTYARAPGQPWRPAVFMDGGRLLDLADAWAASGLPGPAGVLAQPAEMAGWVTPEGQALARRLLALASTRADCTCALADVVHGPPVPRPGKFIAVGRNYMNHVREGQQIWAARGKTVALPTFPASFVKLASAIVAHGMPIVIPRGVQAVDYEIELALVIGRPAYRVPEASALDYVAGYTICNDVGARQIQRLEMESQIGLTLSKNFRSFAPCGPWLVTADALPQPQQLALSLRVNGEPRQDANTSDMIFPLAQLVSYWSQVGLEPGDMITTGTPSGVALARPDPERFYLRAGDVVQASIAGIGELVNPVVDEAAHQGREG